MLLQERWFAGIDLSDRNQTIVEYGPQTRIHEDDELVQRDLLYQKPLTCLNTVHQFAYHGPTHDLTDRELQSVGWHMIFPA